MAVLAFCESRLVVTDISGAADSPATPIFAKSSLGVGRDTVEEVSCGVLVLAGLRYWRLCDFFRVLFLNLLQYLDGSSQLFRMTRLDLSHCLKMIRFDSELNVRVNFQFIKYFALRTVPKL